MKDILNRLLAWPPVAHAMAAQDRYASRLGPQFAAAVTYFTVLSMVPVLMFTFAGLGLTLTVIRPDLMDQVELAVTSRLGTGELSKTVVTVVKDAFQGWRSVTTLAVLIAIYSGSNWVHNLKRAVRVMWSEEFREAEQHHNFFVTLLINFVTFLGLLLCVGIGVTVAQVGNAFGHQVIDWLGWSDIPGINIFWRVSTITLTFVASWILMAFLFTVLPRRSVRPRAWLIGTLLGAVFITILQSLATVLVGIFTGNPAASVLGPVIVVMLLFNVLATMILLSAAWVGTDDAWLADRARRIADAQADLEEAVDVDAEATAVAAGRRASRRWAANHSLDDLRRAEAALPQPNPDTYVSQELAARGMQTNLRIGYAVGTATGVGVGAAIVALLRRIAGRGKAQ